MFNTEVSTTVFNLSWEIFLPVISCLVIKLFTSCGWFVRMWMNQLLCLVLNLVDLKVLE